MSESLDLKDHLRKILDGSANQDDWAELRKAFAAGQIGVSSRKTPVVVVGEEDDDESSIDKTVLFEGADAITLRLLLAEQGLYTEDDSQVEVRVSEEEPSSEFDDDPHFGILTEEDTEKLPAISALWEYRDNDLLKLYFQSCARFDPFFERFVSLDQDRLKNYLISSGLADTSLDGETYLTRDGILLCCQREFLPRNTLHVHVKFIIKQEEQELTEELFGPILFLYDELLTRLTPLFSRRSGSSDSRQKDGSESVFYEYPPTVIIEALVNFLIHRDYSQDDIGRIKVFSDRIEFTNPGHSEFSAQQLLASETFLEPLYRRNARLIEAMNKARINQREGSGILRIRRELDKNQSFKKDNTLGLDIVNDPDRNRFQLTVFKRFLDVPESEIESSELNSTLKVSKSSKQEQDEPEAADRFTPSDHVTNIKRRNTFFTGRSALIRKIYKSFNAKRAAVSAISLTGLGGVGKTQTALEFSYRFKEEYDVIWWVRSEDPNVLLNDLTELAHELQLPEYQQSDQQVILRGLERWLKTHSRWLLVFDDAIDPDMISRFSQESGHCLITSRNPSWGTMAKSFPVDVLTRAESISFLKKKTNTKDKISAGRLADELGYLPLALEQAAGYVEQTGISLSEYLELFRAKQSELWTEDTLKGVDHESLSTTWNLAIETIRRESVAAILHTITFLAPDDIPRMIFSSSKEIGHAELNEVLQNPLSVNESIASLRRYSLIQTNDETFSIHRLVQTVVRDSLSKPVQDQSILAALEIVLNSFPKRDTETNEWLQAESLIPHALEIFKNLDNNSITVRPAAKLMNLVAAHFRNLGKLEHAKELMAKALEIEEKELGIDHPQVAIAQNNLGLILKSMGDLSGAQQCYERSLHILESHYGREHPQVAVCLNNLGKVYHSKNDLHAAKECLQRAMEIDEKNYGKDHPEVATDANNLGNVLRSLGEFDEAKSYIQRALKIDESCFGRDHHRVATDLNNLGLVQKALGDLKNAKMCLERATMIDESRYGRNHHSVAADHNNLALVLKSLEDFKTALEHCQIAIEISTKLFGESHPTTLAFRKNFTSIQRSQQNS
jgi:tetratricopeptide (TPR) repeat protein/predicted HTH transcriptional regulator